MIFIIKNLFYMPFIITVTDCTTHQPLAGATVGQDCTKTTLSDGRVEFEDCDELAMFGGKSFVKSIIPNETSIPYTATTVSYDVVSYGLTSVTKSQGFSPTGTTSVGTACQKKTTTLPYTIPTNTGEQDKQFCLTGKNHLDETVIGCVTQRSKPWCVNESTGQFTLYLDTNRSCVESGSNKFPSGRFFIQIEGVGSRERGASVEVLLDGEHDSNSGTSNNFTFCLDSDEKTYKATVRLTVQWPSCISQDCVFDDAKRFSVGVGRSPQYGSKCWWKNQLFYNPDEQQCVHFEGTKELSLTASEIANLEFWMLIGQTPF